MQVSVSGHHYNVSDRTRQYVQAEAEKLEKFYHPLIDVHATITEEGREHRADLVVRVHAQTLKSTGSSEKVYTAIDQAMNRMTSQLKKVHDKRRDHRGEPREEIRAGG